jgi:pimeloyl-ACP methyl ester carboxylesterase
MATMRIVAGEPYMHDPTLLDRLRGIEISVLVIWGDSDRIVTPAYGAAYAAAFRQARVEIVRDAGHLPQIEQPRRPLLSSTPTCASPKIESSHSLAPGGFDEGEWA